ncbi:tryptophan--tRNA ligase [Taylorella equigenitalis]|uniref:tryptophan--tRNA ligase n=1 Tax=Taylorella equigenitalis TaxID=29575 RepID=UPI000409E405|nr:tryptophan--tRNA ligase [Taylorella equigenitalis]ASY30347.1 tryptophan--tRNA ligase [Taylorella equigenitalis]KOS58362.1 tryptophan--tRNA ligase [Taylorella equigenitalis]
MNKNKKRVLTGITTTGTPHLGNYAGALRPAIEASKNPEIEAFYFLADYHALIKCDDPKRVSKSRLEIAATWLAAGLDPETTIFYRQSDVPFTTELSWILTCMTPKGLMNRAHAYKAIYDQNVERELDVDEGVSMGLYSYPILMAADILLFNAHEVPVGKDQVQHLEMTRFIAQRFNHHYAKDEDIFVLPEAKIDEEVATLPGLDGRKMSKSYNNTIPLFEGGSKQLLAAIKQIQTDSKLPGEPKDPDTSHLFMIYKAFASLEQTYSFKKLLQDGLSWGEAKEQLYQLLDGLLSPMRDRYEALISKPDDLEDILKMGAQKAIDYARPLLDKVREAVGLSSFGSVCKTESDKSKKKNKKSSKFLSFKDQDNSFKWKLISADGMELLVSKPFSDPKSAAMSSKNLLQAEGLEVADSVLSVEGEGIATINKELNFSSEQVLESIQRALDQIKNK